MSRVLRIVFFCATVLWGVEIQAQWKALESDRLHVSDKDEALGKGSSKALQLLSLSGGQNLRAEGFFSNGFLKGFIDLHEGFPDSFLAQHQIEVLSEVGAFRSVRFPAHRLREILQSDWVRYLDVDFPIKPKLDRVREAVRVTQVHEGTGLSRSYKGEGVVVGVVDFGFDLTHPAFQDEEGNLRIKRVWDQSSTSGMPPVGYEYGEELSNAEQILGKRYTSAATTHGTHVAGIAAGSGRGLSEYEGVAPMADLVLVQLHGGISSVAEAVSYIFSYAESVQKPAVVNLSLGTHIGPHDGMSMLDQVFDDLAGMGKIIIGAVGNEGDVPLHLQYDSDGIQESLQTFVFFEESEENTGNGYLNVWGQSGQEVRLAVKLFDEQGELLEHTPFVSTAGDAQLDTVFSTRVPGVNVRIVSESANPYNQKPNLLVWIENAYPQVFPSIELRAAAGAVHVWNDGQGDGAPLSDRLPGSTPVVGWVAGDTEYTIGEIGGTGRSVISAGAFCTKNSFRNFHDELRSFPATLGERAFFSSKGPAVDGRFKPDIAAPGLSVVSSYNSFGFAFDPRINDDVVAGTTFGEKTWYYGSLAGTSMAAPVVAGIVALWLEQGPGLAVEGIKELMSAYSVLDGFTGEAAIVDRNKWGYGKIDAYEVIRSLENNQTVLVGIEEEPEDAFFPNPTSGMVNFAEIASDVSWRVFAPDGRLLLQGMNKNGEKAVNLGSLASGIYMLEADFSGKKIRKRIAVKK